MPDKQEKNNFEEWLKRAEEDEFAGNEILKAERFLAPACFHFQQMAEKLLKALLIFYKKNFPKTHDLLELQTMLLDIAPDINDYEKDLDILNVYYIETRYPGDYPDFTLKEAKEAKEAADKIKGFVFNKINKV